MECRVNVFVSQNIFVPANVKSCHHHLDDRGLFLPPLLLGFRSVNRPYVLGGRELEMFLQELRNVVENTSRYDHEENFTDSDFKVLFSINKEQFRDMYSHCNPVPSVEDHRYVSKRDLLMFLCKLRQGLSDEFLKVMFKYTSRQTVSMSISTVRQTLMLRFVSENVGLNSITTQEFIERHVTFFANELYNPAPETPVPIVCIDGTYIGIHKSSHFQTLRQSYCTHKGYHLIKPALIVAPDGYILDVHGPYFSDSHNNDAAMLNDEYRRNANRMREWFPRGSIFIVDRGYRDATALFEHLGIHWQMPALLQPGQRQHSTEEANETRPVTKTRWIVEARNGHIKSIFKFFSHTLHLQHAKNLGDFYRIAAAIINNYHPTVEMTGAIAELAKELLRKSREPNVVEALVELENLQARNAQRWVKLNSDHIDNFPILTLDFLRDLTVGVYQVHLSPSYVQDKLRREANEEFQLEVIRHPQNDRIPDNGLLRLRIFSRFRNGTKYQLWIAFKPTDEDEPENDDPPILGYYCTCKSGAPTLGTCAHVASVLWFLGYARHEPNVRYPSTSLNDAIVDAAHRN